jgi:cyclopropane fatty-acyl-phospholipid synthase-like methyltransferase
MLKAHLDESHDKASYKAELRKKIVDNIIKMSPLKKGSSVLDLGCGPGLYAKEFAKHGIYYTGIDISRQSLGYAMAHKGEHAEYISYIQDDYTVHEFSRKYDCITMIWCDFGALSPVSRDDMLKNVKSALKDGGKFMFDVYSTNSPFEIAENKWKLDSGGFWSDGDYALLERSKYYKTVGAALYEAFVITREDIKEYRIWDKRYSKEELLHIMKNAGFKKVKIKKGGLSKSQKEMYGVFTEI